MTEDEKRLFLTTWCDYAEACGAIFPNGRPDGTMTDLVEAMARAAWMTDQNFNSQTWGEWCALFPEATENYRKAMRAALQAIEAGGKYRVVPSTMTDEMSKAAFEANIHPPQQSDGSVSVRQQNAHIWQAALSAAPKVTGT